MSQYRTRCQAVEVENGHVHGIQRVLDQQAKFGVTLHGQATVEKQRVRVVLAPGQAQEVVGAGADGEMGLGMGLTGLEMAPLPDEVEAQAGVPHMDAYPLTAQPLPDIIGQLARESKAGRFGPFVLCLALGFGLGGFAGKSVIKYFIGGE